VSWSINLMGTPENVAKALDEESGKLSGQSKLEYDEALPHLKGLVAQNFGGSNLIDLEASGSGSAQVDPVSRETKQVNRSCSASIKTQYKRLV